MPQPSASSSPAPAGGSSHASLRRSLGVGGAVMLGLGSIVGTGVFVSTALAAGIAGPAVLLAIVLAAGLATCNGLSSAQLATAHPVSGGTYEYGYRLLAPPAGFTAGWMFLLAKSASAATAALGCAGYLAHLLGRLGLDAIAIAGPNVAALIVLAIMALVLTGIRRSSAVNITIVSITLLTLLAFSLVGLPDALRNGGVSFDNVFGATGEDGARPMQALLHATALMFVAYTGYGRIATLGEEVHQPRRTIPIAIIVTLSASALLYIGVAAVGVGVVGAGEFAAAAQRDAAPLEAVAARMTYGGTWLIWLVAIGAVTAMLGVLLNLVLGLSRVVLAMARRGDVPARLAQVTAHGNPAPAVVAASLLIVVLLALGSVKAAWSFSAFTVLIYYGLTNAAALRLPTEARLYPRAFAWLGLAGCVFLAFWVEPVYWAAGLALIALGLVWRAVYHRWSANGG